MARDFSFLRPDAPPAATADEVPPFGGLTDSFEGKLLTNATVPPVIVEQYRTLAWKIESSKPSPDTRVLLVTSAVPLEGKSFTSVNLALTLSRSYERSVLLIDADLRRPTLHVAFEPKGLTLWDRLGAPPSKGAKTPDPSKALDDLARPMPHLSFMASGGPIADPVARLSSPEARQLVDWARSRFEWVIIDSPPVLPVPDTKILARYTDGVVLVVRMSSTPYENVSRAVETVGPERVLGVVMNGADLTQTRKLGHYYEYYSTRTK